MEALPWPAITAAGGGWLLFGLAAWLIIHGFSSGKIVPRSTLEDEQHEAAEWRTESRLKDQQILELTEQNTKMLNAFGPTLRDFLRSLRRAGVGAASESGDDQ